MLNKFLRAAMERREREHDDMMRTRTLEQILEANQEKPKGRPPRQMEFSETYVPPHYARIRQMRMQLMTVSAIAYKLEMAKTTVSSIIARLKKSDKQFAKFEDDNSAYYDALARQSMEEMTLKAQQTYGRRRKMVAEARKSNPDLTVAELAREVGLSERTVHRAIAEEEAGR